LAFEKLATLQSEGVIDEILLLLEKLSEGEKGHIYNLSKHALSITERYSDTLKKLAQ
jgi:hypothetical protein